MQINKEFCLPIQNWFKDFFTTLEKSQLPYAVLRNYDELPKKAGFDIDILVSGAVNVGLEKKVKELAKKHELMSFYLKKGDVVKLIICNLSFDKEKRNWALFDIQTKFSLGEKKIITEAIEKEKINIDGLEIFVPSKNWGVFFDAVQTIRKNRNASDVRKRIEEIKGEEPVKTYIDTSLLKGKVSDIAWHNKFSSQIGVKQYKDSVCKENLRKKLGKILFYKLPFIHRHKPRFIVISGPDGVGKTTLAKNIYKILENLPIVLNSFHHTELVKDIPIKEDEKDNKPKSIIKRIIKPFIPSKLLKAYGIYMAEYNYIKKINNALGDDFYSGGTTISDRYVYDRAIKMNMIKGKHLLQKKATKFASKIMRPPMLLIIPEDTPENILKRKQELTEEEIKLYYDNLNFWAKEKEISTIRLNVAEHTIDELAVVAVKHILEKQGKYIFENVNSYKKTCEKE